MKPTTTESKPLKYAIASSTQHSGKYIPKNILYDKPQDLSSRWSSALQGKNHNQWLLLRLESLAVLKTITFGKYCKAHPCNVKEMKVFAGMGEDTLVEVLHVFLKNDAIPETFHLKHANSSGVPFPARYVKIMPISGHAPNFHVSVWHVALAGIDDETYVDNVRTTYDEFREEAVMRYVLKHLRQRRLLSSYQEILSRSNIKLEHPLVTQFHEELVLRGQWSQSEQQLQHMASAGLFDTLAHTYPPYAVWTRLLGTDADGDVPPARGGHAMCVDPVNEIIYIFGGWSGSASLDDLWAYSVREDKWKVLCHSTTSEQNAPGARSCHKMVFDTKTGCIYLLGRLTDDDERTVSEASRFPAIVPFGAAQQPPDRPIPARQPCSEFYRYHTRGILAGKWDFLSIDTASSGGPPLIFDHQMVMDSEAQVLWVFGGRIVDEDSNSTKYSGLYSYDVATSTWKVHLPGDATHGSTEIPGRYGHSMVFDPEMRTLFIFAGKRDEKYLSDMYAYNIDTGVATEIFSDFTAAGGPPACFTQRAVIDTNLKEIYIIFGIMSRPGEPETVARAPLANWVYKYSNSNSGASSTIPARGTWLQILREPNRSLADLPSPRFAHQVAYIPRTRALFLHGGNAGRGFDDGTYHESVSVSGGDSNASTPTPTRTPTRTPALVPQETPDAARDGEDGGSAPPAAERRLDDFWRMELKRPGPEETIRRAKFEIRKQQFREMCEDDAPIKALGFLQTQVSSVVDHSSPRETEVFRALLTHLLSPPKALAVSMSTPVRPSLASTNVSGGTANGTASGTASGTAAYTNGSSGSSAIEREDTREMSNRPQKRSRGDGPGGAWTTGNPSETSIQMGYNGSTNKSASTTSSAAANSSTNSGNSSNNLSVPDLRDTVDPLEARVREEDAPGLSGPRYKQRTEVFENILKLVGDGEKQPAEGLLDLIEQRDRCHAL